MVRVVTVFIVFLVFIVTFVSITILVIIFFSNLPTFLFFEKYHEMMTFTVTGSILCLITLGSSLTRAFQHGCPYNMFTNDATAGNRDQETGSFISISTPETTFNAVLIPSECTYSLLARCAPQGKSSSVKMNIKTNDQNYVNVSFNASYAGNYIQANLILTNDSTSSLNLWLQGKSQVDTPHLSLQWKPELFIIKSSALNMGYKKEHLMKELPTPSELNSWEVWLNEKKRSTNPVSEEDEWKSVTMNISLKKENLISEELTCKLSSEDIYFDLFNMTTTIHRQRNRNQTEIRLPLGLTINTESKTQKINNSSVQKTAINFFNHLCETPTMQITSLDVTWVSGNFNNFESQGPGDSGSANSLESHNIESSGTSKNFKFLDKEHQGDSRSCSSTDHLTFDSPQIRFQKNADDEQCERLETNSNRLNKRRPEARKSQAKTDKNLTRVQEVNQTLSSYLFHLSSNMTVDVATDRSHIVWIYQHLNLPICSAMGWSLKQIFNFSEFSGWEYVVSRWKWGNMVVKGEWGQSFFQNYQKTFAFSFDQDIPLPSTNIVLDFKDYKKFIVKFVNPTLASAVITSLSVDHPHFEVQVQEQDEFAGEFERKNLILITASGDEKYLELTWSMEEERLKKIGKGLSSVIYDTISHPSFCGKKEREFTMEEILLHLVGYKELYHFWNDMQNQLTQITEIWEDVIGTETLKALQKILQQYHKNGSFNTLELYKQVRIVAERIGLVDDLPQSNGLRINFQKMQQWFKMASNFWTPRCTRDDWQHCILPYEAYAFMTEVTTLIRHYRLNSTK